MPGLCSVGWRLVNITSPSRRWRYTILPPPIGGADPPASFAPDPAVDTADRDRSVFATASLRCGATRHHGVKRV